MPTVQIQQFHCAGPRLQELDCYRKNSCSCQSIPSLTARVSKITLHDGNFTLSSKGFSSIIQPSRKYSPSVKTTRGEHFPSQTTGTCRPASPLRVLRSNAPPENHALSRSPTPTRRRFLSPNRTSYRSVSANRFTKSTKLVDSKQAKHARSCDAVITNKLENIYISKKHVDNKNLYVQKKESEKRNGANYNSERSAQMSNTLLENKSGNKNEASKSKTSTSTGIQRLHPGWRKVPWKSHFGWTDSHQELCKLLRYEVAQGSVDSIYYSSEEAHAAAGLAWATLHSSPFLPGPAVSSVAAVLEVIRQVSAARSRAPWVLTGRSRRGRWASGSGQSEYDADDED